MAQDDNRTEVEFGADTSDLERGVKDAADIVQKGGKDMADGMEPAMVAAVALGNIIAEVAKKIAEQLGDAIKRAVGDYAALGDSIEHLQHRIGTSAETLSQLKVGLDSVGLSTSTFESISRRLPMVLERNSEKFKAAGVAYTDADGNLLSMQQTIENIVTHLDNFTAGSARNAEGVKLLGRTFYQFADLVEMTKDRMAEAKKVADDFGLTLTEKDLTATNEFSRQTKLLTAALEGFYVYVGKAITPALTELATNLRESLIPLFEAFKVVVQSIVGILGALWMGFVTVSGSLIMLGKSAYLPIQLMHALWTALTSGGRDGLAEAKKVIADYKQEMTDLSGWVVNEITRTNAAIAALVNGDTSAPVSEPNSPDPNKGKVGAGTLAMMQAEADRALALQKQKLAEMAAANEDAYKHQIKTDEEYWQDKIAIDKKGFDAEIAAKKSALVAVAVEEKNAKISDDTEGVKAAKAKEYQIITELMVLERKRSEAAVQGEREMQDAIRKTNLERSKDNFAEWMKEEQEIIDAQKKQAKMREDMLVSEAQHQMQMGQLEIEQAKQNDAFLVQNDMMTNEKMLDNLRVYEKKRLELELAVIAKEKQRRGLTAAENQALLDKELEARKKFDLKISELDKKKWAEENKYQIQFAKGVASTFQNTIQGILSGTMKLTDGMKSLFQGLLNVVAGIFAQIAAKWIEQQLMMLLFGQQVESAKISGLAAEAGAGGVASMAAAPFPLNLGAPAFGAAMYASAMAFGGIGGMLGGVAGGGADAGSAGSLGAGLLSAAGGYDIPSGVNPLTQLHQEEMVLPSHIANPLRDMVTNGGGSGGTNITIHAVDGASVKRLFMQHGASLVDALKVQTRNFNTGKRPLSL